MRDLQLAGRVVRDAGFDLPRFHESGFTAVAEFNGEPLMVFAIGGASVISWEVRGKPVTEVIASGHGIAALTRVLAALALLPARVPA